MKDLGMVILYCGIGLVLAYLWGIAEVVWQALCSYINDCKEDKENEELDLAERAAAEAVEESMEEAQCVPPEGRISKEL